jgi:hypothetical protein
MHADDQPTQKIFNLPQKFLVPLFQRRYRWSEDNQWEPLWNDVERVTNRLLVKGVDGVKPHFFGAIVLQAVENPTGSLQERIIIDGQQRLTTLQLLMHAAAIEMLQVGAKGPAGRLTKMVSNDEAFWEHQGDKFKIRPTHEDRPQFDAVTESYSPLDYDNLAKGLAAKEGGGSKSLRILEAHEYFSGKCREWIRREGEAAAIKRAEALDKVLREHLVLVVIDLSSDENSQEIFETLNSRGVPLTAADLIKNLIFQQLRLTRSEEETGEIYDKYWRDFDKLAFWDEEESLGRIKQPRTSAFLGYWLTSQTGEETVLGEVFQRFKSLILHELDVPIEEVLNRIKKSAAIYRKLVEASFSKDGNLSRPELFMYRIKALDSNIAKSIALSVLDEERNFTPEQVSGVLDAVESWIVRRAIMQLSTKRYNYMFAEIVQVIRRSEPDKVVDAVESHLKIQTSDTAFWPDDETLRIELSSRNMYKRRARGRMILEAIEDHYRGWKGSKADKNEQPQVQRMKFSIEHLIPRGWEKNWALPTDVEEDARNRNVQLIGNLTLVTAPLNSSMSNGKWETKKTALIERDIGFMNKKIVNAHGTTWTDTDVLQRTKELTDIIVATWPTPPGHKVVAGATPRTKRRQFDVSIPDLLDAGLVLVGQVLYPKSGRFSGRNAQVTEDAKLLIEGKLYETPTGAAVHLTKKNTPGWGFWLINTETKETLKDVRHQYLGATDGMTDDDDDDVDDDDEIRS